MRPGLKFSASAILVSAILTGTAAAQTAAPAVGPYGSPSWTLVPAGASIYDRNSVTPGSEATPERLSDGTLAESADTTALTTPTYHQPTGFLPGMKP